MSEANNPTYRPSSLRNTSNLSISTTFPFLPSSFEEAVYGDFDTLLEFARSQHQEESLAFWLGKLAPYYLQSTNTHTAVEDFRQFEKRYEHGRAFDEMRREFALDATLPAPPPLPQTMEEETKQQDDNNTKTSMLNRISGRMNALGGGRKSTDSPSFEQPRSPRRDAASKDSASSTREEYVKQRKRKMSLRKRRTNIKYNHDEAMLGLKSAMLEYARDIFCEFLDEDSDHWICLHERISGELHDKMERADIDASSFDEAQRVVFAEMKVNLYPGYLKLLRTRHANLAQQHPKKSSTVTEFTTGRLLADDDNSED